MPEWFRTLGYITVGACMIAFVAVVSALSAWMIAEVVKELKKQRMGDGWKEKRMQAKQEKSGMF